VGTLEAARETSSVFLGSRQRGVAPIVVLYEDKDEGALAEKTGARCMPGEDFGARGRPRRHARACYKIR
jgi:hypothetical protein